MAQNKVTEGRHAKWLNDTGQEVTPGQPVLMGDLVGVCLARLQPGQVGAVALTHVYRLPKVEGEEIALGRRVFITADGQITAVEAPDQPAAGFAFAAAAAAETYVAVLLRH